MAEYVHTSVPSTRAGRAYGPLGWHSVVPVAVMVEAATIVVLSWGAGALYNSLAFAAPAQAASPHALFGAFVAMAFVVISMLRGNYSFPVLVSARVLDCLLVSWVGAYLLALAAVFLLKAGPDLSRAAAAGFFGLGFVAMLGLRVSVKRTSLWAVRHGMLASRRVMLVGDEAETEDFLQNARARDLGWVVVGRSAVPPDEKQMARIVEDARFLRPDGILVMLPWSRTDELARCVEALSAVPTTIHLALPRELARFRRFPGGVEEVLSGPEVIRAPLSVGEQLAKRAFDLTVGGAALVVLLPIFLVTALAIRLESRGPVVFRQLRHGFNHDTFLIYKFRTMRHANEGEPFRQAQPGDPRLTRIGGFLRRWNLDELPQLLNVIRGEMSIVGPRPHALAHNEDFAPRIAQYARRHNIKPGITGWAQVNGLRGPTDTDEKMKARVEHDLYYLDNWSLWFDVRILVLTVAGTRAYKNAL